MPRDIPVGNGSLLVTHDHNYCLRDIFFPSIGKENHTGGHGLRLGIWVDNVFAWMGRDWHPRFSYLPETLVSEVNTSHEALAVAVKFHDAVDYRENIYIKKIILRNQKDRTRSFRIFFHQDFHILESPVGARSDLRPGRRQSPIGGGKPAEMPLAGLPELPQQLPDQCHQYPIH